MSTDCEIALILASASPRRSELLGQLGLSFTVKPADINESIDENESAQDYVQRMAYEKAKSVWAENKKKESIVIGSDTIVVIDGQILGKPNSRIEAKKHLTMLSGKTHQVLTAVTVMKSANHIDEAQTQTILNSNVVSFTEINNSQLMAYLDTDEPYDKAGSYAIQGKAAQFITAIKGSYSGVMGLPLYETAQMLNDFGMSTL